MEVNKLLRLIKDDISHLEGIADEFLNDSLPSPDEVEVALVRSNALLKELELLFKIATQIQEASKQMALKEQKHDEVEKPTPSGSLPIESDGLAADDQEVESGVESEIIVAPSLSEVVLLEMVEPQNLDENSMIQTEVSGEAVESIENKILTDIATADEASLPVADSNIFRDEEQPSEEDVAFVSHEVLQNENIENDETVITEPPISLLDERDTDPAESSAIIEYQQDEVVVAPFVEVKKTLNETLGEAHQLVNDILSPEKPEAGFQIIPINSIWDGVGINDRFLFIRELFANSSAKFETTVAALDKLETIQDAVSYLKMHFKWNKTEASQKFLVLVKRRFTR